VGYDLWMAFNELKDGPFVKWDKHFISEKSCVWVTVATIDRGVSYSSSCK